MHSDLSLLFISHDEIVPTFETYAMLPLKKYHFTLQNLMFGLRNFFYVKKLRQIRCRHHWYTVYQKEINPVLLLGISFCLNAD